MHEELKDLWMNKQVMHVGEKSKRQWRL